MDKIKFQQLLTKYQMRVIKNGKANPEYYDRDYPVWASAVMEAIGDLHEEVEELKGLMLGTAGK